MADNLSDSKRSEVNIDSEKCDLIDSKGKKTGKRRLPLSLKSTRRKCLVSRKCSDEQNDRVSSTTQDKRKIRRLEINDSQGFCSDQNITFSRVSDTNEKNESEAVYCDKRSPTDNNKPTIPSRFSEINESIKFEEKVCEDTYLGRESRSINDKNKMFSTISKTSKTSGVCADRENQDDFKNNIIACSIPNRNDGCVCYKNNENPNESCLRSEEPTSELYLTTESYKNRSSAKNFERNEATVCLTSQEELCLGREKTLHTNSERSETTSSNEECGDVSIPEDNSCTTMAKSACNTLTDDVTDWLNDDLQCDEFELNTNIVNVNKNGVSCASTMTETFLESKPCPERYEAKNGCTYKQLTIDGFAKKKHDSKFEKKQTDIGVFFGLKPKQTDKEIMSKAIPELAPAHPTKEKQTYRRLGKSWNRKCPFYKKVEGTSFAVDAFSYGNIPGISHYFLSHFHYDHYHGLQKNFANPIYCSQVTANLVVLKLKVASRFLHVLPLEKPVRINNIEITLVDANHCPGAVMFLFKFPDGKTHLHTGDFRASALMESNHFLSLSVINTLYLDTTLNCRIVEQSKPHVFFSYCNPDYSFPPQSATIDYCVSLATEAVASNGKTLIVVGAYTIGKEKIFVAIADALRCKVAVRREKFNILQCLEWKHLKEILTQNYREAQVHVLPMSHLTHKKLAVYLKEYSTLYREILAIKPTGWTFTNQSCDGTLKNVKPSKNGPVTIYGIPYSEHSSYRELEKFVKFIRPTKILPTVNNGSASKREEMSILFKKWLENS